MWFADIGVVVAWILLAVWGVAAGLVAVMSVRGRPGRVAGGRGPARACALAGTGVAAVLFTAQAGLVDAVADSAGPGPLDQSVWAWFVEHRGVLATVVMTTVSLVGGTAGMALLAAVGAGVLWWRHHRAEAGIVVIAAVGAGLLSTGFKDLYDRARPPVAQRLTVETNPSLPSGHALGSIVVLGVLAAVAVLVLHRVATRTAAAAAAAAAIVLIGVSRLYLGVHWATDVATGWLLGGTWLALCVTALVTYRHHAAERTPPPPSGFNENGDPGSGPPCRMSRREASS